MNRTSREMTQEARFADLQRPFGALFPTTYFIALMRAIILRGANFFEYWPNLLVLIVMSNLLFSLCALRFRKKLA